MIFHASFKIQQFKKMIKNYLEYLEANKTPKTIEIKVKRNTLKC